MGSSARDPGGASSRRNGFALAVGALALAAFGVSIALEREPPIAPVADASSATQSAVGAVAPAPVVADGPPRTAVVSTTGDAEEFRGRGEEGSLRIIARAIDAASGVPLAEVRALATEIDPADDPVADRPDPAPPRIASATWTDDGVFTVACDTEGLHLLQVWSDRHLPIARRVTVRAGAAAVQEIPFLPAVLLSGELLDAAGAPVADAYLQLTDGTEGDAADAAPAVVSDAAGMFGFPPVAPGRYVLRVESFEGPALTVGDVVLTADEPEPFRELRLPSPAELGGRVTLAALPASRTGLSIRLTHEDGAVRIAAVRAEDGGFSCAGLGPGRWRADLVLVDGSAAGWLLERVAAVREDFDIALAAGERSVVDVPDPRAWFARLTVRVDGPAVPRRIVAERIRATLFPGAAERFEAALGPTGVEFEVLPPGAWRVRALASDDTELAAASVELPLGGAALVELRTAPR